MNFIINLLFGLLLVAIVAATWWSIRYPEKAERIKWLRPVRYYLSRAALRRWTVNILGAAVILWFALFYINWIQPALTPADLFPPEFTGPLAVKAHKVDVGPVVSVLSYTGKIEPYESNEVYARVDGFVESLNVYEGDYVRKGDILARLDLSQILPMLNKAVADSVFMFAEFQRAQKLFEESAISASEFDNAKKSYENAVSQVQLARAKLAYATIRAGIDGYVAERAIYPGQYVMMGMKTFRIDRLDRVRIKFPVSEQDLPFIRPRDRILLEFPQFPMTVFASHEEWRRRVNLASANDVFHPIVNTKSNPRKSNPGSARQAPAIEAQVAVVFPAVDEATHTGVVEVRMSNPGTLLKSNGYVVGKFAAARVESAIRVPTEAIIQQPDGGNVVFIAPAMTDEGFAEVREIRVGLHGTRFTEILSGLKPGEYVVYAGMKDLTKGQSITVLQREQ